jgi:chromosomal replication initiation ATPase DnaA
VALLAGRPYCAIEGAENGVNELALLHLVNIVAEQRGFLLLTGREPLARWRIALPDLRSRLNALPAVGMTPPGEGLLAAVLAKLFADRQLQVRQDVIDYVLPRLERSFEAARQLVTALDDAALADHRAVTVPLAREVLRDLAAR